MRYSKQTGHGLQHGLQRRRPVDVELGEIRGSVPGLRSGVGHLAKANGLASSSSSPALSLRAIRALSGQANPKPGGSGGPSKLRREATHLKFDIDESSDAAPVAVQLRDALTRNAVRVMDLFRDWDTDGDGQVSKKEFRRAMRKMGFDATRATVDEVFDSWDADRSGQVDFNELNKQLRRAGSTADLKLTTETNGDLQSRPPLGRRGSMRLDFTIDESADAPPVSVQLRNALSANAVRVLDFFREWDDDESGQVKHSIA
jgi:hypothetical protein